MLCIVLLCCMQISVKRLSCNLRNKLVLTNKWVKLIVVIRVTTCTRKRIVLGTYVYQLSSLDNCFILNHIEKIDYGWRFQRLNILFICNKFMWTVMCTTGLIDTRTLLTKIQSSIDFLLQMEYSMRVLPCYRSATLHGTIFNTIMHGAFCCYGIDSIPHFEWDHF